MNVAIDEALQRIRQVGGSKVERWRDFMDISELDFTGYSMVERNPAKLSGTPILRGSRMPAQGIIENYVDGYTPDEIADLFQLPPEGVRALVAEAVARNPGLRNEHLL